MLLKKDKKKNGLANKSQLSLLAPSFTAPLISNTLEIKPVYVKSYIRTIWNEIRPMIDYTH